MAARVSQPGAKSIWAVRGLILPVFLWNLSAAVPFVVTPGRYTWGFEVSGTVGELLVRSIGILFLMWVVPYVPALIAPQRHRVCLAVTVIQQGMGLAGESWMALTLPAGHAALWATGTRFIAFDAAGLVLLVAAWALARKAGSRN